ncbi:PepSY-associated TM helix domain-containing protein [Fulvivirgaceae bacterium BMA12]|uniref:PepSY-associated TM helix domain-containing protein n=1 Tax=Agaribacillus aureus TaxID=3051825 RepID=A0ABT8LLI6_9BACT|nr:PepSY-associated TM helix domain-containing protein [Fulvivirgaceae bacterium BMA12]
MAKKNALKNIIGKIHLYLGLASGVVVFIVAITGCFWVFQEEILGLVEVDRTVQKEDRAFISPTKAKELAHKVIPGKHIHGTAYGRDTDPLEVIFYEPDPLFYQSVFLNPYSGEVLGTKNYRGGFFGFVLDGHLYLWLPRAIGSQVTSYGTMVFVLMLITGIILWWPKNKKGRRQRLKFDWKSTTRWRRKNFDLHAIMGFYASVLALVLAFSGLVMAFDWIYFVTYKTWGGEKAPQFIIPNNISTATFDESGEALKPIDKLIPRLIAASPDYKSFEVHYPATDSSSIYVETSFQEGVHYSSDYRFYDQHTLEEIDTPGIYGKYEDAKLADKVIRMNYDIHVGAIGGIFGKILAFIISFITASLPVTGFLLWWGRKNKKNDKSKVNKRAVSPEKMKRDQLVGQTAVVNTRGPVRAWFTRFFFLGVFIITIPMMAQAYSVFGRARDKNSQTVLKTAVQLPTFTTYNSHKIK